MSKKYEPPFRREANVEPSRKVYSDRFRQDTARPTKPVMDDFPALMSSAQRPVKNISSTSITNSAKKPTFAELAGEWTRKVQEQKAKEDAEKALVEEAAAKAKAAEDRLERERMKLLNSGMNRMHVTAKRKYDDGRQLDIGCALSDNSEDEYYHSNDDVTYEEEEEEEEDYEEDETF